jgi:hypothetical protein
VQDFSFWNKSESNRSSVTSNSHLRLTSQPLGSIRFHYKITISHIVCSKVQHGRLSRCGGDGEYAHVVTARRRRGPSPRRWVSQPQLLPIQPQIVGATSLIFDGRAASLWGIWTAAPIGLHALPRDLGRPSLHCSLPGATVSRETSMGTLSLSVWLCGEGAWSGARVVRSPVRSLPAVDRSCPI